MRRWFAFVFSFALCFCFLSKLEHWLVQTSHGLLGKLPRLFVGQFGCTLEHMTVGRAFIACYWCTIWYHLGNSSKLRLKCRRKHSTATILSIFWGKLEKMWKKDNFNGRLAVTSLSLCPHHSKYVSYVHPFCFLYTNLFCHPHIAPGFAVNMTQNRKQYRHTSLFGPLFSSLRSDSLNRNTLSKLPVGHSEHFWAQWFFFYLFFFLQWW